MLVFFVLTIEAQRGKEDDRSMDFARGSLRLKIFRVGPYLVYRTVVDADNEIESNPSPSKSAFPGYRQGYGAFRGRRAVIPKEALNSDNTIQAELERTVPVL